VLVLRPYSHLAPQTVCTTSNPALLYEQKIGEHREVHPAVIRNDSEYQEAQRRLEADQGFLQQQRQALKELDLSEQDVEYAMQPALSFHAQLHEEIEWYERVKQRDFGTISSLTAIGQLLIAARIANGMTQRELADKLGVKESQASRDERNEYHGITVERAQRVLDALDERISATLDKERRPQELVYA